MQRTANTNAVHVNRYDAAGNLKSSAVDSTSWEDRDTQCYEWANDDEPPPGAVASSAVDDRLERFFSCPSEVVDGGTETSNNGLHDGGEALVLTSSERRDVPAVSWSGTQVEHELDAVGGTEHRMTTKLDGSQWSRSGESVWISSSVVENNNNDVTASKCPTTVVPVGKQLQQPLIEGGEANGRMAAEEEMKTVNGQTEETVFGQTNGSCSALVMTDGRTAAAAVGDEAVAASVEERRRKRAAENLARRGPVPVASTGRGSRGSR
jgi:hypothetical protein